MSAITFARRVSFLGGLVNILGVLTFSAVFTNPYISSFYPDVFSTFGLVCIILWGLAYIAAGLCAVNPALYAVFAVEKVVYGISWIHWMLRGDAGLSAVFEKSALTGLFYTLYGPIDWTFAVCFGLIAWRGWGREADPVGGRQ